MSAKFQPLFKCVVLHWEFTAYTHLWTNISLPNTGLSELQHLSRDPWTSPCQRTKQKVLEEVLFCPAEVRALFLQQGNFQGQLNNTAHQQNVAWTLGKSKSIKKSNKCVKLFVAYIQTTMLQADLFWCAFASHWTMFFLSWIKFTYL